MELKQFLEVSKKIKRFFEVTQKKSRCLRLNISQQGFYGEESRIRIFKPGELISGEDIRKYRIPAHLFMHPDSLRNMGAFKFAAEKKDVFSVGIIRTISGLGDVLLLSIIGKALKEQYPGKAKVWFAVHPGHEVLLENNPHIDKVFTSEEELMDAQPDIHFSINDLEFKAELREEDGDVPNRTALYLSKMGLSVENKTPTYIVTEEEKLAAQKTLKKLGYSLKKPIIGVQLYGSNISKTYPHMRDVAKKLKEQGHQTFYLDTKPYKYGLREVAAIANEMALMITPNSFFYHLAGALRKRAIALFGYTDGAVWTEDYEKVIPLQIPCPKGRKRCWWRIECIPGADLKEKENKATPECLANISVEQVLEEVNRQPLERKSILIVMLTYNGLGMTKQAVDSIRSFHDYDIFIVDNISNDGTIKWLQKNNIKHISKQASVAEALNIGLKKAYDKKYDYVLVCNNDIILEENYIDKVVEIAERRKCFAVSGRIINKGGRITELPSRVKTAEASMAVTIAGSFSAILLSRECLEVVGKFDERYRPRYQEDDDYLLRIRLSGNDLIYTYLTSFLHLLGQVVKTIKKEKINYLTDWNRNVQQYKQKWGFDPYKERNVHMCLNDVRRHCPDWQKKILIPLSEKSKFVKDKRHATVKRIIEAAIRKKKKADVLIMRKTNGYGDIILSSIIARALKKYHKGKVNIDYAIQTRYMPVLDGNPYIRKVMEYRGVDRSGYDFVLDISDYEYRAEMNQTEKFGRIKLARTELYLDLIKYKDDLKPDYFVTGEEKTWAERKWNRTNQKRIAINFEGSNLMKYWPGMESLQRVLINQGYHIIRLDEKTGGGYRYSFRQMGALIAKADLVISPDTGASNLAGALEIPVITIFSHRNGENFARMFKSMVVVQGECPHLKENYCDYKVPCISGTLQEYRKKENVKILDCFQNLKVEKVLEEVKRILK